MPILSGAVLCLLLLSTTGCHHSATDGESTTSHASNTSVAEATPPDRKARLEDEARIPVSVQSWTELDNPATDGWVTEVLSERADTQLKQLSKLLDHPERITAETLAPLADPNVSCEDLLPSHLRSDYDDGVLEVQRPMSTRADGEGYSFQGFEGLDKALRALTGELQELGDVHSKFKLFRVHQDGDELTTRQYVTLTAHSRDQCVEQHATWSIRWKLSDSRLPRIQHIAVLGFERVARHAPRWFTDCTVAAIGRNDCFRSQLMHGYGHWLERIPHGIYLEVVGTPGIAMGDVNGDGLDDLYLCQERGLPNRLFLQQADGTMQDVSADWGVDWLESSRAALLIDLDNDGDQDLVVSMMGGVLLASNEQQQHFRYRRLLPTTEDVMSLAAADYDDDGDVDLYVCGYYADKTLEHYGSAGTSALPTGDEGFVMHDANVGGPNQLLRNDIQTDVDRWGFADVTESVGLDTNNRRFTFAASWEDYDNDGDQDLYVVNEFGRDNFYRNEGGRFQDISDAARVEDAGSGMGITWGDYDRDGRMDVYISNMFSAAGNRVTFQDQFKADSPASVKRRIQRLARGNTLLRNAGNGSFDDTSGAAGVEMGRWSWDSKFADLNNDGWLDLLVANGYITANDNGDL